ncbi:PTS lactose/cellobiose transporter subunit IIA [Clostridium sp. KNHs216]|uniref:PTS lactose/cellobiose transporter subunit IIA n=1 Tax=Clostridium sp. KNHs216 TaxID=1550235 RepID=UPI0011516047|nr:PTS lactose/cellobiose transporter subunit IIA [Clostridium sp. KNHs216]TQI66035.1 PTS system cellobiose-specific IIA component [Clostridium sp. KNHs216]
MYDEELMQSIAFSGDARSMYLEALEQFRLGKFEEGKELINKANGQLLEAKKNHAEIISKAVTDENLKVSLLMVHAEDHINATQVIRDLMNTFCYLFEKSC